MIEISNNALAYLKRKQEKSKPKNCRIFLVAQHCHGAQFAYRFDSKKENDEAVIKHHFPFVIDNKLLALYGGFVIELKSTFLMDKLVISPRNEQHVCSCLKG